MKALPSKYSWLYNEPAPRQLKEALFHYGILEHVGKGSDPNIMAWAKEVGVSGWYTDDDIPWCGLFVGVVMQRVGYAFKAAQLLSARQWINWGKARPKGQEKLWDILVFQRDGGGHVGFYVGENAHAFLVYGGNQSNAVGFAWIDKSRLLGARYPAYKIGEPANVRKILLSETGELSKNEA
ncbi:TIGR02594 family protein [Mucilaginibacter gynuensis]|uniref:TIGR02594 family protein n=1 Tax=Mucilaginibacter gynuensis TaxID=1302236 RepID=A0ABP8HNH2_9SPHI